MIRFLMGAAVAATCAASTAMGADALGLKPIEPAALQSSIEGLAKDLMLPGAMVLLSTPQGNVVFGYGTTELGTTNPPRAEGSVSVRTKNLEPVLEALAQKDLLNDIVPILTRLDDFRAKTTFRSVGKVSDMTIESESDVWDVSGRVYSNA